MIVIIEFDHYWDRAPGQLGAAHAVSSDPEPAEESIRLLHEAVQQVTGQPVAPPARPRMGFLP